MVRDVLNQEFGGFRGAAQIDDEKGRDAFGGHAQRLIISARLDGRARGDFFDQFVTIDRKFLVRRNYQY
jgi:hypothetical protein